MMRNVTLSYRRTEPASTKQFAFLRTLFILTVLFFLLFLFYWITGDKKNNKLNVNYSHWKNKHSHRMACGVQVQNDPFIKINNLNTYLVGSYMEHRQENKMIRTIAIVLRSEQAEYQCMLCCNKQMISVPATYDIHSDHFGFEYGTADITCLIPQICPSPTHVAITSRSPKEDGSLQDIHVFQPIRNQRKLEVFPYKFTVCISTMFDYVNVLMLVQAMEMFRLLGVQKVAIYKTSCHPVTQKVLDYYVRQNFVEIIPWRISSYINVSRGWQKSPGDLHYWGQLAALNDCVYRYMYQSHYVALQDLDEFILPIHLKSWTELLPELEMKYSQDVGFEFETFFFPLSITDFQPEYSPDAWKKVMGVNILEHISCLSNNPNEFNDFKVIVNPRLVFKTTVHGFLQSVGGSVRVDSKIAHIYHMRNISKQAISTHSHIQDTHHRDYAEWLIPAVSKVLQQTVGEDTDHSNQTSSIKTP